MNDQNEIGISYAKTLAPGCEPQTVTGNQTVSEILQELGASNPRVMLWDGQIIPERFWDSVRISPGNQLMVREVPQGDNAGRTVALIAVAVVSAYVGNYAGSYAAAQGATSAGAAAVTAAASTAVGYAGPFVENKL